MGRRRGCSRHVRCFVASLGIAILVENYASILSRGLLTTIERRFALSSAVAGIIPSCFQFSNTFVQPFVSYFGGKSHRPRCIAFGGLLMVLGAIVCCLPQFVGPRYEYAENSGGNQSELTEFGLCVRNNSYAQVSEDGDDVNSDIKKNNGLYIFLVLGCMLFGIGASPFQPLGMSYIDDFSSARRMPLYVGFIHTMLLLGPTLSYLTSAALLNIWVDIGWTSKPTDITPEDFNWVGAWWIAYIIAGVLMLIVILPFFTFPREMHRNRTEEDVKGVNVEEKNSIGVMDALRNLWVSTKRLLTNTKLILVAAILVFGAAVIVAIATFYPKYLEVQFGLTPSEANVLHGAINLPAVTTGTLIGGAMVTKINPSSLGMVLATTIPIVLANIATYPQLFIGCDTANIHGIDQNATTECNEDCGCYEGLYNPVCDEDHDITYLSPCHAGCHDVVHDEAGVISNFTSCECTGNEENHWLSPGKCESQCSGLIAPAIAFKAAANFCGGLSVSPTYTLILRIVDKADKSYAIGLVLLALRLLGWLPGPVLYGSIIDSTCLYWGQSSSGVRGNCRIYDNRSYRLRYFGAIIAFQILTIVSCFTLYVVVKRDVKKLSVDRKVMYEKGSDEKGVAHEVGRYTDES